MHLLHGRHRIGNVGASKSSKLLMKYRCLSECLLKHTWKINRKHFLKRMWQMPWKLFLRRLCLLKLISCRKEFNVEMKFESMNNVCCKSICLFGGVRLHEDIQNAWKRYVTALGTSMLWKQKFVPVTDIQPTVSFFDQEYRSIEDSREGKTIVPFARLCYNGQWYSKRHAVSE